MIQFNIAHAVQAIELNRTVSTLDYFGRQLGTSTQDWMAQIFTAVRSFSAGNEMRLDRMPFLKG